MRMSWQYIAGFYDGEGHLSKGASGLSHRVGITQTGADGLALLTYMAGFMDAHNITSSIGICKRDNPKHATRYDLNITNRSSVEIFLRLTFPYLHIKKLLAQDTLRLFKMYAHGVLGKVQRQELMIQHNKSAKGRAIASKNAQLFHERRRQQKETTCQNMVQ